MSPALEIPVIVAAGILSGFINTLASSGSAVTLPLMILIGLPANVANGTNRLPILAGAVAALVTFHRAGVIEASAFLSVRHATFFLEGSVSPIGLRKRRAKATWAG